MLLRKPAVLMFCQSVAGVAQEVQKPLYQRPQYRIVTDMLLHVISTVRYDMVGTQAACHRPPRAVSLSGHVDKRRLNSGSLRPGQLHLVLWHEVNDSER